MAPTLDFERAMMTGLAPDGGLYVPEAVPVMTEAQIAALAA
jgi:threonine synthase